MTEVLRPDFDPGLPVDDRDAAWYQQLFEHRLDALRLVSDSPPIFVPRQGRPTALKIIKSADVVVYGQQHSENYGIERFDLLLSQAQFVQSQSHRATMNNLHLPGSEDSASWRIKGQLYVDDKQQRYLVLRDISDALLEQNALATDTPPAKYREHLQDALERYNIAVAVSDRSNFVMTTAEDHDIDMVDKDLIEDEAQKNSIRAVGNHLGWSNRDRWTYSKTGQLPYGKK